MQQVCIFFISLIFYYIIVYIFIFYIKKISKYVFQNKIIILIRYLCVCHRCSDSLWLFATDWHNMCKINTKLSNINGLKSKTLCVLLFILVTTVLYKNARV